MKIEGYSINEKGRGQSLNGKFIGCDGLNGHYIIEIQGGEDNLDTLENARERNIYRALHIDGSNEPFETTGKIDPVTVIVEKISKHHPDYESAVSSFEISDEGAIRLVDIEMKEGKTEEDNSEDG